MVLAEDLRQAVLQAALQGKLTEQLEIDSNVDEILKSIQEEKNRLVADKKSKKETALPEIQDEDIPFDIPDNWRWIKIGEIVDIKNGFTPKRTDETLWNPREIPWFTVEDIHEQGLNIFHTAQSISKKALGKTNGRIIPAHTVLLCCTSATIGRYAMTEIELTTNQQWNGLVIKKERKHIVCSDYILVWVSSLKEKMTEIAKSTTFPFLSVDKLANFVIPLPPIEEQQRIVDKINEIMPKIDEYEKIEKELETLKKEFPNNMKDALLQAAMQGKLTEQLESDRSVDEFIRDEEIDMLDEDNYPYFVPDNWRFTELGNLTSIPIKRGKSPKYADKSGILVFAQKCNQKNGSISLHDAKYLDENMKHKYEQDNYLQEDDIVINSTGGGTLGRIGYISEELIKCSLPIVPDSHVTTIRTKVNVLPRYIYFFLKFNQSYLETMGVGSTNQTELRADTIKELAVPLPPIEEQKRIVERLDALLPLCEDLKEE